MAELLRRRIHFVIARRLAETSPDGCLQFPAGEDGARLEGLRDRPRRLQQPQFLQFVVAVGVVVVPVLVDDGLAGARILGDDFPAGSLDVARSSKRPIRNFRPRFQKDAPIDAKCSRRFGVPANTRSNGAERRTFCAAFRSKRPTSGSRVSASSRSTTNGFRAARSARTWEGAGAADRLPGRQMIPRTPSSSGFRVFHHEAGNSNSANRAGE